jgi:hypothetical protein
LTDVMRNINYGEASQTRHNRTLSWERPVCPPVLPLFYYFGRGLISGMFT